MATQDARRLEAQELIDAAWGTSENNRKARFYRLTKAGRSRLAAEANQWQRLVSAMGRELGTNAAEG